MKHKLLIISIFSCLLWANIAKSQNCTAAPSCNDLGYTTSCSDCSSNIKLACPFDASKCLCVDTTHPTCSSLGYSDMVNLCPGDYLKCPHDSSKVRCLLDAAVGDLKYSWKTSNHDGWLLCDGSRISKAMFPDLVSLLGSETLPSYSDYFLKGAAATNITTFKTEEPAGLPNIKGAVGSVLSGSNQNYQEKTALSMAIISGGGDSGSSHKWRKIIFNASQYNQIYKDDVTTVTPQNYSANIFIYAGKKSRTEKCKVGDYLHYDYEDGKAIYRCSPEEDNSYPHLAGVVYKIDGTTVYFATSRENVAKKCYAMETLDEGQSTHYAVESLDLLEEVFEALTKNNATDAVCISEDKNYWVKTSKGGVAYSCDFSGECTKQDFIKRDGWGNVREPSSTQSAYFLATGTATVSVQSY